MVTKAEESPQILRARKKIADKILKEEQQITQNAIEHTLELIHHWRERHKEDRIPLKSRKICVGLSKQKSLAILTEMLSKTPKKKKSASLEDRKIRPVQKGLDSIKKEKSRAK